MDENGTSRFGTWTRTVAWTLLGDHQSSPSRSAHKCVCVYVRQVGGMGEGKANAMIYKPHPGRGRVVLDEKRKWKSMATNIVPIFGALSHKA